MDRTVTILLTGAAGSLGSALALQCAKKGSAMVLLDRDQRGLERVFDAIVDEGLPEPAIHPLDLAVAGPDEFREVLDAIADQFGVLSGLVHCAIRFGGLTPLEHVPPREWLETMQVNVNSAWLLSAMSLPMLRRAPSARLCFILENLTTVSGAPWGPYGVSKHALHALVSQFAGTCQGSPVEVLGINPGPMQSPLRSRAYLEENPARLAAPETVAARIADLLHGSGSYSGPFVDLSGNPGEFEG